MALADTNANAAEEILQMSCSLDDIKSCPSSRILKVLLNRMRASSKSISLQSQNDSENEQQDDTAHFVIESLKSVIEKHEYSATKLLDDLHHLQYEHQLHENDAKFDEAFDFFQDCSPKHECDVNVCPFMRRYYRERGRVKDTKHEASDDILMDIMAQIHCYY